MAIWLWHFEQSRHRSRLSVVSQAYADALDGRIESFKLAPRLLADDPRLVAALRDASAVATANRVLSHAQQETGLAFLFLMSRTGLTVASSNHADTVSFVGQNYAFRPYFRGAVGGEETRHFAVGATTGRPGYFVAIPVFESLEEAEPIGVIVGKLELDELMQTWQARANSALVLDSYGVSILATDESLLYLMSQNLDESTRARIESERPYRPREDAQLRFSVGRESLTVAHRGDHTEQANYLTSNTIVRNEPWTVIAMLPRRDLVLAWFRDVALLLGVVAIVWLLLRVFVHRRRMAQVRATQAAELERLVTKRTEELESAQRALIARSNFEMLGRMSAAINHEINQPLASLRLDLASARTLLRRDAPDVEAIAEVVIDADRTTKRIGRVVETLRRVAGPPVQLTERVSLAQLLADFHETVRRERPVLSQCLVVAAVPSTLGELRGNAVLLQQALLNLAYNAFDAVTDVDEPRVDVVCFETPKTAEPDGISIAVTDNGRGVAPELVKHLYEPFARSPNTQSGLGLGLALAHDIAARHDGRIVYSARTPGSCFELQLPMLVEEGAA